MFAHCLKESEFKQGLGIALECKRLDKVKEFITQSGQIPEMVEFAISLAPGINSRAFRNSFLEMIVDIYRGLQNNLQVYPNLAQCLFTLDKSEAVAELLKGLIDRDTSEARLVAFQIAFNLSENENQEFLRRLINHEKLYTPPEPTPPEPTPPPAATEGGASAPADTPADGAAPAEGAAGETAPLLATEAAAPVEDAPMVVEEPPEIKNLRTVQKILSGRAAIDVNLAFLYRNNHTDLLVLDNVRSSVDQRNSVVHNAIVLSHAIMQCGTTSDVFLRNNLEWMARATNWSKFSVTASLGVIHKGHIKEAKSMLSTYLPQADGPAGSPYSEGGALFGMGLIHAGHSHAEALKYLSDQLAVAVNNEVLQHGACLGYGLTAMATHDMSIYEELKAVLFTDSAVAGEAAAYAIGLVMVGSKSQRIIPEILAYAHDTQHEKIIRGCAIALAMMMFKQEEDAESLIQDLLQDKDPILRYGGCFTIAMAYCGTGANEAVRRLLHVSVSDVSDDVRRAAVLSLGFVMCNEPEQLPPLVKLLAESYNPHVRYAAAMALGICCAGTGNEAAYALLEPLQSDASDFVRQGAMLAIGFLLMQSNDKDKVEKFRQKVAKVSSSKHEDVITRFGAILGQGIIDAGGRNVCTKFFSQTGVLRTGAAIGMLLFSQMWFWFPLINCLSMTFAPTAIIGVTEKLGIPTNFKFRSGAAPSTYAYPAAAAPPKQEEKAKTTAVLSTLKSKKIKERKTKIDVSKVEVSPADEPMEVADSVNSVAQQGKKDDVAMTSPGAVTSSNVKKEGVHAEEAKDGEKKEGEGDKKEEKKDEKEPNFEILANPARVLPAQSKVITYEPENNRYHPTVQGLTQGIILLSDKTPDEPEELLISEEAEKKDEKKEGEGDTSGDAAMPDADATPATETPAAPPATENK